MRDLLSHPLCHAEDLGKPIPETPYGVSVCLPLWEHVIGYEEKDPAVVGKFQSGYPRFFLPPAISALFEALEKEHANYGERAIAFPSVIHAERCAGFVTQQGGGRVRVIEHGKEGLGVALFPAEQYDLARRFWRFCGEIVSSRQAEDVLGTATQQWTEEEGGAAREKIKDRLAGITGQRAEDIFLFPSGMAATYAVHRMLTTLFPGRKTIQLDFPYVDVLKLQERFGSGAHFLPFVNDADFGRLREILQKEEIAGFFAELPSNPLMKCVDLRRVSELLFLEEKDVPIIVDDTVATSVNVDAFLVADVVTTSLTKAFSGMGDVMAGSVIINQESPFHEEFTAFLREHADHQLWRGDAVVLEANSRDYVERVKAISSNSLALYELLGNHPAVESVYHSVADDTGFYDHMLRTGGGHGGLLSFVLKDRSKAPAVYDALEFCKGPSLGTNYSLVCPFTLLAHYDELDWAESCGVDRTLIRFAVGLEPQQVLLERVERALRLA